MPDQRENLLGFELSDADWMARVRGAVIDPPFERFGPYELLGEGGRGGQGVVYKARQPRTGREVALKRLSAGVFATPEMRARFDREIEAIAALHHPNVVTLYGSEIIDGQAVVAMQWIDGVAIDQWVARSAPDAHRDRPCPDSELHGLAARDRATQRRDVREVLELFLKVCDAVQHAHQRGVIHRDLKPSNILVDRADQPHVLDFGLARLRVDSAMADSFTQTGAFVGTPAYAAPEQIRGQKGEIDVRTDVYSLGAVLYQALTGRTLFEHSANLDEMLRAVREREPRAPSALDPRLDREIDAIVLKALAKDQEQRYPSVDALRADLQRYLAGQAVLAHPPSTTYRVRKFVRLHRWGVGAGVVLLLVLVAATAISLTLFRRTKAALQAEKRQSELARQESERAEAALIAAQKQSEVAGLEAHRAFTTTEFLREMLESAGSRGVDEKELTVRQMLDRASEKIERESGQKPPELEAAIRMIVANTYRKLELREQAEPHYARALELRRRIFGEEDNAVAEAMDALGRLFRTQGRLSEAEPLIEGAYRIRKKVLRPDDGYLAVAANSLGLLKRSLGKYDEAEAAYREALEGYETAFGPDDENIPTVLLNLGVVYTSSCRHEEAVGVFRDALERATRIHDPLNVEVGKLKGRLALALLWAGDPGGEPESLLRDAIATVEAVLGAGHPEALEDKRELGKLLSQQRRFVEAESLLRDGVAQARETQRWSSLADLSDALGRVLQEQGQWSKAEEHLLCVESELSAAQAPPAALEKVRASFANLNKASDLSSPAAPD